MDWTRTFPGWVLFVVGLAGIVVSWSLTGFVSAAIGVVSVIILAAGVVIIGTRGRRRESASGGPD